MNIQETKAYIQEISRQGSVLGLDSIRTLMGLLDHPEKELTIIHVAGTNGKGSVSAMLQAALTEQKYRVGRFNSPAVFEYEEMFQINQEQITEQKLAQVYTRVREQAEEMFRTSGHYPTLFEVETAAAFVYFQMEACDFVIMEVGLGGREDATNVITSPACCVITSISMDHGAILGPRLSDIARAKAGIMKPGVPVVSSWQEPEVSKVLRQEANRVGAELVETDRNKLNHVDLSLDGIKASVTGWGDVTIPLTGNAQLENLSLALTVLETLKEKGFKIDTQLAVEGMSKTRWPGRFQKIADDPMVILDGAHNPDAAKKLGESIRELLKGKRIFFLAGVLGDKEYDKVLSQVLPLGQGVFTVTPANSRALQADELCQAARKYLPEAVSCESVEKALDLAYEKAEPQDVIICCGSLSYLGDVERIIRQRK